MLVGEPAARLLREHAFVRVLARGSDGDALCATALLGHALRRDGIDFHATWVPRVDASVLEALGAESNALVVCIGLDGDAAGDVPATHRLAFDARDDASAGATVHHAALALSPRNADLAPLALAGALAAKRHVGGLRGADLALLEDAERSGLVSRAAALPLRGSTLLEAVGTLDEPAVPGLTGRARNVKKLLSELSLAAEVPPGQLASPDAERLAGVLALRLLQHGAPDVAIGHLARPRVRALQGPHTGFDLADLAWLAESAATLGKGGLGLAALWPDETATNELQAAAAGLRDEIVAALLKAEREARREGPLVVADAPRAALCPALADRLALLHDAVVLARAVDDEGPDDEGPDDEGPDDEGPDDEGPKGQRATGPPGDAATIAVRRYGRVIAPAVADAARACGGTASGSGGGARARVPAAEEQRFVKLLGEALS